MNYKKFFSVCEAKGIKESQITYSKTTSTDLKIFHKEINSFSNSCQSSYQAKGIYNNQLAMISTEKEGNDAIEFITDGIVKMASVLEKEQTPIIFKGSEKYHKKNLYSNKLTLIPLDEKIKKLYELESHVYSLDERVKEVIVYYTEEDEELQLLNSYGLKLSSKSLIYTMAVEVVCRENEDTKSNFDVLFGTDFEAIDFNKFADKLVKETVSQFGGVSCKVGTYKVVFNRSSLSNLLSAVVNNGFSADNIQKKASVLVDKLNEQVFNSKVTIEERPLEKNCFFRYFDDEGVATYNKKLVEKGVVKNFLYNIESAQRENKESTGNGYQTTTRAVNIYLKPGKLDEEGLFNKCNNGIYVTSISGLHSGLNPQSGDFSIVANGYYIKDGKIDKPATLLTIGGNIYTLFNDVIAIGSNIELCSNSVTCPSVLVKNIKVSSL